MIPLGSGDIPASGEVAADRIATAISKIVKSASARPQVSCDMISPAEITSLVIDLSNIESAASRAQKPTTLTTLGPASLNNFRVTGDPVKVYGAPVAVKIHGEHIPATWSRDDRGDLWLVPTDTSDNTQAAPAAGSVDISARTGDVEKALRAAVAELADANGARLKDLQLRIESAGPRAIVVAVDVAAAKFMMTAKVRALAEANLSDDMTLHIGHLDVKGEGAAGAMVANLLGGKIAQWRGRKIALGQYVFAGAALRDVKLEVGPELRLSAQFGQ